MVLKMIRLCFILAVMVLGFIAIVGTSSDDAKKVVSFDFEKEAEFALPPVNDTKNVSFDMVKSLASGAACNTTNIKSELDKIKDEIEDLDKVKIKSVRLEYIWASYTANWSPMAVTDMTCRLVIEGPRSGVFYETAINTTSGSQFISLTDAQKEVINYYLSNRNTDFTYCVECYNHDNISQYSVTYAVDIGVIIKGEF